MAADVAFAIADAARVARSGLAKVRAPRATFPAQSPAPRPLEAMRHA